MYHESNSNNSFYKLNPIEIIAYVWRKGYNIFPCITLRSNFTNIKGASETVCVYLFILQLF